MTAGDNQIFEWTVGDVRKLDSKLDGIREMKSDIKAIKKILNNRVVVSNSNDWNWKTMAIIIGSVVATIILTVEQATK